MEPKLGTKVAEDGVSGPVCRKCKANIDTNRRCAIIMLVEGNSFGEQWYECTGCIDL